jgi:hypothetical protein
MPSIEISNLQPVGSDLFNTEDSFLSELSETEAKQTIGGKSGKKSGRHGGMTIFYAPPVYSGGYYGGYRGGYRGYYGGYRGGYYGGYRGGYRGGYYGGYGYYNPGVFFVGGGGKRGSS